jgi:hypothetical protein
LPEVLGVNTQKQRRVGFEALRAMVMKSSIFCDIMPCSPFKVNRRFGQICRLLSLPPAFTLVSCLAYSSTLKVELTFPSETSVDIQRTTWRYIPEVRTLHNRRHENRKSYIVRAIIYLFDGLFLIPYLHITKGLNCLIQDWIFSLRASACNCNRGRGIARSVRR